MPLSKATSGPAGAGPTVQHLVLDTAAIITGVRLDGVAQHYWTVEEVLAEVRDARARDRLASLPFELVPRRPSDEAMRFGASFSFPSAVLLVE